MARYILGWVDIARAQYAALPAEQRHLVDLRLADLIDTPDGSGCHEDSASGQWTTTDRDGAGLILYTFRPGLPRLVILRLVY